MKPGFAAILNLTHATMENLKLEKTEWGQEVVEPHTGSFGFEQIPGYKDAVLMMLGGLAAVTTITIIGVIITFLMHYKRKLKAAAAAVAALP